MGIVICIGVRKVEFVNSSTKSYILDPMPFVSQRRHESRDKVRDGTCTSAKALT
jgi:hypothetical protein